jgi:hypothetical protein
LIDLAPLPAAFPDVKHDLCRDVQDDRGNYHYQGPETFTHIVGRNGGTAAGYVAAPETRTAASLFQDIPRISFARLSESIDFA